MSRKGTPSLDKCFSLFGFFVDAGACILKNILRP